MITLVKRFITSNSKFQNCEDNDHNKDNGKDPDENSNYIDREDDKKHL